MKKTALLALILCAFTSLVAKNLQPGEEKEKEEVKKFINECYIDGLANKGDFNKIDEGFHPGFTLYGLTEGNKDVWTLSLDKWKESIKGQKESGDLPRSGDRMFSANILSVDITSTTAVVKLELYEGQRLAYIDYLSLYKIDGAWKIISKTYYKVPESK